MIRPEDLGTLFTLFHDGVLAGASRDNDDLVLTVDIRYLAQRVHPDHTGFTVRLREAGPAVFFPWASTPEDRADPVEPADHLLGAGLDILEGAVKDGALVVTCSGAAPHRGGDLVLQAAGAQVTDPSGRSWSLPELSALAKAYWDEFRGRQR